MPNMPAFCDNCGVAFPSGIFVENVMSLTLQNNKAGPCPKCGGMGSVPDGIFNIIGNAIGIVSAPMHTVEQLKKLSTILSIAKSKATNAEEIALTIKKEIPELSSLRDILPKTRTELYAFLALLVAAIGVIVACRASSMPKINVQNIVQQSVQIILERK